MLIDCDTCRMRDIACGDCVISLLLGAPEDSHDLDDVEAAALGALAAGGLAPPLRLVPVGRTNRPDLAWSPSIPDRLPSSDPNSQRAARKITDRNRSSQAASGP